ncbi:MAG: glycosyltransferase family 2 protein [Parvularculaceae bacterium]|nr:glycosyltransferase family 2 protein [Parvularculaceae bacterium]
MIGFVAIGRNEGERLGRCLSSLRAECDRVVYVDSGSTDGSPRLAADLGCEVVALGAELPFTAARARNAGFQRLVARWPDIVSVMFIDGDCELAPGFTALAARTLDGEPRCGVVAGRVRERERDKSIYNRLCDMEWATPSGEVTAVGGIFMTRAAVFARVGGFDPKVIAAEDDELCIRIRAAGFGIRRLDADMCFHDAGMTRFSQWWRRAYRAGHAFAQVGAMHKGYFAAERRRALAYGLLLPLAACSAAPVTQGASLLALLLYPASLLRIRWKLVKNGAAGPDASLYAAFLTLSKFPNFLGIADYWRKRLLARPVGIVEYK